MFVQQLPINAAQRFLRPVQFCGRTRFTCLAAPGTQLLDDYRIGIAQGAKAADLDRAACKFGYSPENIINAHAIALHVPHHVAAQEVAQNVPEMANYIKDEYAIAEKNAANAHKADQGFAPPEMLPPWAQNERKRHMF